MLKVSPKLSFYITMCKVITHFPITLLPNDLFHLCTSCVLTEIPEIPGPHKFKPLCFIRDPRDSRDFKPLAKIWARKISESLIKHNGLSLK